MRKLKNIAFILLLTFIVNFIPVNAYYAFNSKFGIQYVGMRYDENGERTPYVSFDFEISQEVKSVKLYTNVVNYIYNYEMNTSNKTVVAGAVCNLDVKEGNEFIGSLAEEEIKAFGNYEVDRIEITLNDGSKRISYNSDFYSELSGNNKENGELIWYDTAWHEFYPVNIETGEFKYNILKLGQTQEFNFKVNSIRESVQASKVYITFKNITDDSARNQVVIADLLADGSFTAKLNLTSSIDSGEWIVSEIEFVDNYDRSYVITNSFGGIFKVVSENTDIAPPKLLSIEASSNIYDYNNRESIDFTLEISDDISGLNHGYIYLTNGSDTETYYINRYDMIDNKVKVDINNFKENGIYEVKQIYLVDNANNYSYYINSKYREDYMNSDNYIDMDFSHTSIEVINKKVDSELEFEILEIINNATQVTNGNEVEFEIKAQTNKRINYINVYFLSPDNKRLYYSAYYYPEYEYDENGNYVEVENKDGIYKLKFFTSAERYKYIASGEYRVDYIQVYYKSENNEYKDTTIYDERYEVESDSYITYNFSELDFTCENPNEDITPPEILEISLDKTVVTPGENVEITVKVSDDNSGFKINEWNNSLLDISYSSGGNYFYKYTYDYNEEHNEYKFTIEIPEYYSTGKYTISNMSIRDVADNYINYSWWSEEDKALLSQGTILVKNDLNELLPPEISTNIEGNGQVFKAPFEPVVSSDHGTISMLLNNEVYNGEPITKLGNYKLYITATGVDGSVSTKLVSFKVIAEISNETTPEEVIDQIINSPDKVVEIEVKNEEMEIDKSIFEAIKGTDKEVSFTQEDGTVWTFAGKDITDENLESIGNVKISVSSIPEEENREQIESLDSGARVIHFDYHGILPGKATVKIKVDNPDDLMGKDLTFYYFNPETQQAEKVQGPLSIDKDGYITVEIEHCSDYFLSEDNSLHVPVITLEKEEIELIEGETEQLKVIVTPEGTEIEYISSNEEIATIDKDGFIEAKSAGSTEITIKAGGTEKKIKVTVKAKVVEPEETPNEPEAPEEAPDVPEAPEETPNEPEAPEETPDVPEAPEETPDEPEVPEETPDMPEPEETPDVPEVPEEAPVVPEETPEAPEIKPEISVTPEDVNNKKELSNNENENKIPLTGNVVSSYVVILTSLLLVVLGLILSKKKIAKFK